MVNVGKYTIHGCYGKMNSDNTNWGMLQKWLWLYCRRTYTTCSRCGCRGKRDKIWITGYEAKDADAKNPTPAETEVVVVPTFRTCHRWKKSSTAYKWTLLAMGKTNLCNSVYVELWLFTCFLRCFSMFLYSHVIQVPSTNPPCCFKECSAMWGRFLEVEVFFLENPHRWYLHQSGNDV